jgi:hypothetical protein
MRLPNFAYLGGAGIIAPDRGDSGSIWGVVLAGSGCAAHSGLADILKRALQRILNHLASRGLKYFAINPLSLLLQKVACIILKDVKTCVGGQSLLRALSCRSSKTPKQYILLS